MKLCRDYGRMSEDQRREIREQRFRDLVSYARKNSPYYRELYSNVPEDFTLADLPPVDKRTLMEHWNDWVCDRNLTLDQVNAFMEDKDNIGRKLNGEYLVFTTSGSTGNPLVTVCDRNANNIMGAISAVRAYARKEDLIAFIKRGGKSIGVFADEGFYLGNSSIRSRLLSMPWKKKQKSRTRMSWKSRMKKRRKTQKTKKRKKRKLRKNRRRMRNLKRRNRVSGIR